MLYLPQIHNFTKFSILILMTEIQVLCRWNMHIKNRHNNWFWVVIRYDLIPWFRMNWKIASSTWVTVSTGFSTICSKWYKSKIDIIAIDFELLLDMIPYHGFEWTEKSLHPHGLLYQQAFQLSAGSKWYKPKIDSFRIVIWYDLIAWFQMNWKIASSN